MRDGKAPLKRPYFCNALCKDSYRTDRIYGIIYPSYAVELDTGVVVMGVEDMSRHCRDCVYCGKHKGDK